MSVKRGANAAPEGAMDRERWGRLMESLGLPRSDDTYARLMEAHAEPHRHYHTVAHVEDCLRRLDEAVPLAKSPEEVEIALWFHDAVYKPTSSRNEARSARWARQFLEAAGASGSLSTRVHGHIMATRHAENEAASDGDTALVVDIDLSILGSCSDTYQRFEDNVRREYRWVPWPIYRRKRRDLLEAFLARAAIYTTDLFQQRYEEAARRNIASAIRLLQR